MSQFTKPELDIVDSVEKEKKEKVEEKVEVKPFKVKLFPDNKKERVKVLFLKLSQTILFYVVFLCVGFLKSILGPLLSRIQQNVGCTEAEINWVLSARSLGLAVGAPIGGLLFNIFRKSDFEKYKWYSGSLNRVIIVDFLLLGGFLIIVPFIYDYVLLIIVHVFQGIGCSIAEVGCNLAVSMIWRSKVTPFLQALHCFSGLGSLLFPLIISQVFLYIDDETTQLMLSYILCGVLILVVIPFIFLVPSPKAIPTDKEIFEYETKRLLEKKKEKERQLKELNKGVEAKKETEEEKEPKKEETKVVQKEKKKFWKKIKILNDPKSYFIDQIRQIVSFSTIIYSLTAVIKGATTGEYSVFGNLIYQYCESYNMGTDVQLAYLTTVFWAFFTAGRFVGIWLTLFIPPFFMMLITISGSLYAYIIMNIFPSNYYVIWAGVILHGLFVAPISASSMGLPQTSFKIPLNGFSTSIISSGSTVGNFLITLITANAIIPLFGEIGLMYGGLGIMVLTFVDFILIFVVGAIYKLFKKKKETKSIQPQPIHVVDLPEEGEITKDIRQDIDFAEGKSIEMDLSVTPSKVEQIGTLDIIDEFNSDDDEQFVEIPKEIEIEEEGSLVMTLGN